MVEVSKLIWLFRRLGSMLILCFAGGTIKLHQLQVASTLVIKRFSP
jgi:hypothetical protein